jgi:hypothetical protein
MNTTPRIQNIIGRLRLDGLILINVSGEKAVSAMLVLSALHLQKRERDLESGGRRLLPLTP